MGIIDDNKKRKKDALPPPRLFQLIYRKRLFQNNHIGYCQPCRTRERYFYLYFEDKYDLRNRVIAYKAGQLFDNACQELEKNSINSFEEELLFITDYIIDCFCRQHSLMEFVAKKFIMGYFQTHFFQHRIYGISGLL